MARKILKLLLLIAHGTPFAPMNEWLLTPRAAQKKENPLSICVPVKSVQMSPKCRVFQSLTTCLIDIDQNFFYLLKYFTGEK